MTGLDLGTFNLRWNLLLLQRHLFFKHNNFFVCFPGLLNFILVLLFLTSSFLKVDICYDKQHSYFNCRYTLYWAIPEKKKTGGGKGGGRGWAKDILFWKTAWNFSFFNFFYPLKFQTKQSSNPRNSAKLCYIPWKFQRPKTKTPVGNSTSFFINPWKFHMLFLWHTPGNLALLHFHTSS